MSQKNELTQRDFFQPTNEQEEKYLRYIDALNEWNRKWKDATTPEEKERQYQDMPRVSDDLHARAMRWAAEKREEHIQYKARLDREEEKESN